MAMSAAKTANKKPGTQHAFDIFPSIRSAAVTRGVERFLRWTYDAAIRAAADETDQEAAG